MRAAGSFGLRVFVRAVHARTGANKRLVKNSPALICATPIRSLRTEWSRMENKAASASRAASEHRLTDRDFAAQAPKPSVASFSEIPRGRRPTRRRHARIFQKACRKPAMPSRASCRGSSPEKSWVECELLHSRDGCGRLCCLWLSATCQSSLIGRRAMRAIIIFSIIFTILTATCVVTSAAACPGGYRPCGGACCPG